MSIDTPLSENQIAALQFKSSSFNVPALVLASHELETISSQLEKKLTQAPDLFKNSAVLIDLHKLTRKNAPLELAELIKILRSLKLIPIAVSGATATQNKLAIELGIAVQTNQTLNNFVVQTVSEPDINATAVDKALVEPLPIAPIPPAKENKVITQPVRSGQRIYATGDLTVLAPVSSSAELMAEGNIHVYAPLRGRVLAGVQGDTQARIFCSDLQAELVSIAGIYKINEELDKTAKRTLVQIYLHDQALLIEEL